MDVAFDWLQSLPPGFIYGAIILLLLLCGLGLPITEELLFIFTGVAAHQGLGHPVLLFLSALTGMLCGDYALYWVGSKLGGAVRWKPGHSGRVRGIPMRRIRRAMAFIRLRGDLAVFIARFLIGLRTVVFLGAGASRFPRGRFLLFDGLAALINIPILYAVGYTFSQNFPRIVVWVRGNGGKIGAAIFVIGMVFLVVSTRRRKKRVLGP